MYKNTTIDALRIVLDIGLVSYKVWLEPICLGCGWLVVQGNLLCRRSYFSEFHCLASWLVAWLRIDELSKIP
jgi:hypothetical protein